MIKEQDILNMKFGDIISMDEVNVIRFIDGWIVESYVYGLSSCFVPDHRKALKYLDSGSLDKRAIKNIMEYEF